MANGKTGKSNRRGRDTASQRKKGVVSERTSNAKSKDQYFTKPEIAQGCWGFLREHYGDKITEFQFVEPSAGSGSFSRILPAGSLAFDIDPQAPGIKKADFLKIPLPAGERIVVIGNPPFGKNANLAVKFFNRAARRAFAIAMILPRTFLKASLQDRLDPSFKLVTQMDIPKNAFTIEGEDFDAATVFLIWERQSTPRAKIVFEGSHPDFVFTTWEHADFAIWRVGAKAGEIHHDLSKSKSSHYFIKVLNKAVDVEAIMSRLPFRDFARNTVGVPSISKSEIIVSYKS